MNQANELYPTNVSPAPTSSLRPNWPGGMWRVSDVLHRLAKSERLISLYFIRVNGPEWKHHSDDIRTGTACQGREEHGSNRLTGRAMSVYRGRDSSLGFRTELENSVCEWQRKRHKWKPREAESTNA